MAFPNIPDQFKDTFDTPFISKKEDGVTVISLEPILQFFAYKHLPLELSLVSELFYDLAQKLVLDLPRNPERTVALRKLLEAKDAAVRAKLYKDHPRAIPTSQEKP